MIGIAVIGAGQWGPNLIRNFSDGATCAVRWVIDRDPERLAQVEARFSDVRTATNPEEMWDDAETDAVVVATPTSTHADLIERALSAGKHVLVEKPISNDAARGAELTTLASKAGLVLMVGHVFLFNGGVQRVKEIVDSGELGPIFHISMIRTNLGPIRLDVDAAWDLASHDISIANYWLGTEATSASAIGGTWINEGVADAVFATLRFPNEVIVNLHVSWLNPRKVRDITVVAERKMLTLNDLSLSEPLRIYDKGVSTETVSPEWVDSFSSFRSSVREGAVTIPKISLGEPLAIECHHFIECIQHARAPISDGAVGVAVVRALEAISRSMTNGGREEPVLGC